MNTTSSCVLTEDTSNHAFRQKTYDEGEAVITVIPHLAENISMQLCYVLLVSYVLPKATSASKLNCSGIKA